MPGNADPTPDRRQSNLAAFESWLAAPDTIAAAVGWRVAGMDLWPLVNTCLASLAIQIATRTRKRGLAVGGHWWQAGVAADVGLATLRRVLARAGAPRAAPTNTPRFDQHGGPRIVYAASAIHIRTLAGVPVIPPIDVPATLMRRAGFDGALWIDDVAAGDLRLDRLLSYPGRGLAGTIAAGQVAHRIPGVAQDVAALPGFADWCAAAADILGLGPGFLRLWLTRQVAQAAASSRTFGGLFDREGAPQMLVMLNGGFAVTAGLAHAARRRGVPVVEVQHGALSRGIAIAPGARPHFSRFDTAPDAYVGWQMTSSGDIGCLAVGPIGLHLPDVVAEVHATDRPGHETLRRALASQRDALGAHARDVEARREILVSMQPGDDGRWLARLAPHLPPGTLLWLRRHGADLGRADRRVAVERPAVTESALASSSALGVLLARVDVHLTRFSALTLEAAAAGVSTFATDPYAAQLFSDRVPPGLLEVEPDPDQLGTRIERYLAARSGKPAPRLELPSPAPIVPFLSGLIEQGLANRV
jgi:hypothetical protein